jgi:hypothetical protein
MDLEQGTHQPETTKLITKTHQSLSAPAQDRLHPPTHRALYIYQFIFYFRTLCHRVIIVAAVSINILCCTGTIQLLENRL